MSEFFKSKKKFATALGAVFLAVTLLVGAFAVLNRDMAAAKPVSPPEPVQESLPEETPEEPAEPEEEWEEESASFHAPAEMRGAFLTPGVDFLATKDTSESAIRAEVDAALKSAESLDINAVIIDTRAQDRVIYQTQDAPELSSDFDILGYVAEAARDMGFYTYAIFDTSLYESSGMTGLLAVGAGSSSRLTRNIAEFAEKYALDGILLDGYASDAQPSSYRSYLSIGGGIGFDNFMRQSPSAAVKSAAKAIRQASPAAQVGLLADAVWENQSANAQGSATAAAYTSLSGGNADTKGFIEKGYVDFVAVKAYTTTESKEEPFEEVVGWWADVALRNDVPLYVVHATGKLFSGEAGWGSSDQLIRQLDAAGSISGVRGSIFNNLQKVAAGDKNVAENVKKVQEGTVSAQQVLTKLEMTKPAKTTYTTSDPQVTFTGASDPDKPVTINDKEIPTDSTGYFTVQYSLKQGLNAFTIQHKDQSIAYSITRELEILKEVSPTGKVTTEGGMAVAITAVAYQDATVYAEVNGTTVPMEVDDSVESEEDRDGYFRMFRGQFTTPTAGSSSKDLGKIQVFAEYNGEKTSLAGASVTVNKKTKVKDGMAVRITADQALTYPPDTLDNIPDARYFPLPAGAMDYAVGDEIVYKKNAKETFTYYVLESGLRVESKDLTAIDDFPSGNAISGLSVKSEDGFTYVTIKTAQKVTYSVSYAASGISFRFHNTTSAPASVSLSKNPLFSAANWSGETLTLALVKSGCFMGYKGYYDDSGNLVLRFNNPPASLSKARIAIDPGHGGGDKGTSGFLSEYPESVINNLIAKELAQELEARGATVNLMSNGGIDGELRKQVAEQWNADLFVSIHCNSASRLSAVGTEAYYFHPFSRQLAANAAGSVSKGLNTENRGAKASYYHVTLSPQMPSVLIECGFISNQAEYEKLVKGKYQRQIAAGIADALSATLKGASTGVSASGSEGTGNVVDTSATGNVSGNNSGSSSAVSGRADALYIRPSVDLNTGRTTTLIPEFYPEELDVEFSWKSSNTGVATVNSAGRVTGVKEGSATITATTKDGRQSATSSVTVRSRVSSVRVTGVALNAQWLTLDPGVSRTLIASVAPDDATNSNLIWRSDNPSAAKVSDAGRVTAVKAGFATITATTEEGNFKAVCSVTVGGGGSSGIATQPDSGVSARNATSLQNYSDQETLNPGSVARLYVSNQYGEQLRGGDLTWSSDDRTVVTVDSMGNITGKKAGYANVTASYGRLDPVRFDIEVTNERIALSSVSFEESAVNLAKGESKTLRLSLSPSSATNRSFTWSSSDSRVATVSDSGVVKAVGTGKASIRVRSNDNTKIAASCTVEVSASGSSGGGTSGGKVKGFYIIYEEGGDDDVTHLDLSRGDSGQLTYEYYPSSVSDPGVVWESFSPQVVTIDQQGNFRCVGTGTATIRIYSKANGSAKTTCTIRVR